MKKIWTILLAACGLAALSACDTKSGWEEATLEPLAQAQQRHILVEDYTGQICVNCPQAAKQLHTISKTLPGSVLIVSMHAPMTGQTLSDLASETADVYAKAVNLPTSAPHISVNRQDIKGQRFLTNRAEWESAIFNAVNTPAAYRIDLKAQVRDGKVVVNTKVNHVDAQKRKINLQLWVVEDIRARQIVDGILKPDYFHHNVLRGALNGNWGEALEMPNVGAANHEGEYNLPTNVAKVDNAKVIAFVRDSESGEVLEVSIVALGKGITDDNEENPSENPSAVIEGDDNIWFNTKFDGTGTSYFHTQTIECNESKRIMKTEVDSPNLFVHAGKKQGDGKYELLVMALDHLDDPECGISQVCVEGRCVTPPLAQRKEYRTPMTVGKELLAPQVISIHYLVNPARINEVATYRMRMAILKDGVEVAHYFLNMHYDPATVKDYSQPTPPNP